MGKRAYQGVLYAIGGMMLLLDKALMIFEIRSAWGVEPRLAAILGAAIVSIAVVMIARGTYHHDK